MHVEILSVCVTLAGVCSKLDQRGGVVVAHRSLCRVNKAIVILGARHRRQLGGVIVGLVGQLIRMAWQRLIIYIHQGQVMLAFVNSILLLDDSDAAELAPVLIAHGRSEVR